MDSSESAGSGTGAPPEFEDIADEAITQLNLGARFSTSVTEETREKALRAFKKYLPIIAGAADDLKLDPLPLFVGAEGVDCHKAVALIGLIRYRRLREASVTSQRVRAAEPAAAAACEGQPTAQSSEAVSGKRTLQIVRGSPGSAEAREDISQAVLESVVSNETSGEASVERASDSDRGSNGQRDSSVKCTHSDDYRSANWYGTLYTFGASQARCIKILWEHWKKGGLTVHQSYLGDAIGSDDDNYRLRDTFRFKGRKHPAWGTMIQQGGKGAYRLVEPSHGRKPPRNP